MSHPTIRLLLLGDSTVGKSCILSRYGEDYFNSSSITTIGIDFRSRLIVSNLETYRVQIWDTAGQEKYRGLISAYYRNTHAIILVYDITNRDSFNNLKYWLEQVELNCNRPPLAYLLLANKRDKSKDRQVSIEEGQLLAEKNQFIFAEVAANQIDDTIYQNIVKLTNQVTNKLNSQIENIPKTSEKPIKKSLWDKLIDSFSCCTSQTKFDRLDESK